MPSLDLVLWAKGTLLTPQHLQAQDRYLEEIVRLQVNALAAFPWGLTTLEFDREALAGGTLAVQSTPGDGTQIIVAVPCRPGANE